MPSQAPYGYRYLPRDQPGGGQWRLVAYQAAVVRDIFSWYKAGATFEQIATRLNQAGIPSPKEKRWHASTLQRLLQEPAYQGVGRYNRHQTEPEAIGQPRRIGRGRLQAPRYKLRPPAEWITIPTPVIVTPELWQEVQEQMARNQRFAPRNNHKHPYLLRGLLSCGLCGYTLLGRTARGKTTYACRYGGVKRPPDVPPHRCIIAADEIEPLVWQALADLLRQPSRLLDAWRSLGQPEPTEPDPITHLHRRQRELDKQWQRLLDLYQEHLIEKPELRQRKALIEAEQQRLAERLGQAVRQHQAQQYETDLALTCQAFARQVEAALASPSFETQQDVIRLLIEQIIVADDAITIKHIVPAEDDARLCRLDPMHSVA